MQKSIAITRRTPLKRESRINGGTHLGFSLLETAVVLTVIGLLTAGILVGRSLIRAATIRASIGQIESFQTAAQTFRAKYNCIPGDCQNAVALGLGSAGGPGDDGDGNGVVAAGLAADVTDEPLNFWYHLAAAGLIAGSFPGEAGQMTIRPGHDVPQLRLDAAGVWVSPPYTIIDGDMNPFDRSKSYFWVFGTISVTHSGALLPNTGVLTPESNYAIDSKTDDGYPLSGSVTLSAPSAPDMYLIRTTLPLLGPVYGPGGATSPYCGTMNDPPMYNIVNTSGNEATRCVLSIRTVF